MVYFYPVLKAYDEYHDPETAYDHHKSKDKVDPQWLYFQRCKVKMDPEIVKILEDLDFGTYKNGEDFVVRRPRDYLELYCALHSMKYREHFRGAVALSEEEQVAETKAAIAAMKTKVISKVWHLKRDIPFAKKGDITPFRMPFTVATQDGKTGMLVCQPHEWPEFFELIERPAPKAEGKPTIIEVRQLDGSVFRGRLASPSVEEFAAACEEERPIEVQLEKEPDDDA